MKISVVTACYNAERTIAQTLDSVRDQALPDGLQLEYIVVDGASTDGTVRVIREFEARLTTHEVQSPNCGRFSFHWLSEPDCGLYDAINKGIRLSTGDVVGIVNSDDWFDGDNVIGRIAATFTDELDCVYGKVRFVHDRGGHTVRRCFAKLWRPWMLQWGYMPPHPGVFIRRQRFAEWGMYVSDRREYRIAADYELLIRYFRVHGMRAHYSGICTTVMRTGGLSTKDVNARKTLNAEIIKANRANGYFCCWPMLLPKYAIKIWEVILPRIGFVG